MKITHNLIAGQTFTVSNNGWIEWNGGECPVDGDTICELSFRGGGDTERLVASCCQWRHYDELWDIIAYRVVGD